MKNVSSQLIQFIDSISDFSRLKQFEFGIHDQNKKTSVAMT